MWRELIEDNRTKSLRCLIDGATLHGTDDTMSIYEPGGRQTCLQRCEVLVAFWNKVSMELLSYQIMSNATTVQYRFCQNPWHFESLFCPWHFMLSVLSGIPVDKALRHFETVTSSRTVVQQFLKLTTPINGASLWWLSQADLNDHDGFIWGFHKWGCPKIDGFCYGKSHRSKWMGYPHDETETPSFLRWSQARCAWAPLRTRRPAMDLWNLWKMVVPEQMSLWDLRSHDLL